MSATPTGDPGLQFERAEFTTPGAGGISCASCGKAIAAEYYQLNDQIACDGCRRAAEAPLAGSRFGRAAKAILLGTLAGAVGSGLYYGVSALTGYEFGLIAVVVGVMVGIAVRAGSGGRGGWRYQAIAMFLTYASIVSTYIPDIYKGIAEQAGKEDAAAASVSPAAATSSPASAAVTPAAASEPEPVPAWRALVGLLIGVTLLFAIAFVAPFLAGIQNILGLVIIGIGLYEAWKINKRAVVVVTGPYRVAAEPAPAAPNG
jgi:hypothetical protein